MGDGGMSDDIQKDPEIRIQPLRCVVLILVLGLYESRCDIIFSSIRCVTKFETS